MSNNSGQIAEFDLSPNGRWVVTNESQNVHYPYDNLILPKQFLYDFQEKSNEEIFVEKNTKPSGFVWTLESDSFYCAQPLASNPDDDYVSVQTLFYFELKSKNYHQVPLEGKWYLDFFGYYMTKEGILVSLANSTRNKLAFYKKIGDNWQQTFLTDEFGNNLFIRHMNQKGDLVIFSHSTASTLPQIKLGRIEGNKIADQKDIIKLNDDLKNQICLKYVLLGQEMSIGPAIMAIARSALRLITPTSADRPGEPHGLRKLSHQRRKMEEELAWFEKYLFKPKSFQKPDEMLNKDSPLALELKKRKISQIVGYYEVKEKNRLIPEVVSVNDSYKIGRFEVTRAQYPVFKYDYIYPPGTDNYPVNNITFDVEKVYCQWLSEVMRKKYDLPSEKEMKILLAKNKSNQKNENNLDYWAGYSPTPDEVDGLQPIIAELELSGLLLLEVGSRKPISDKMLIFDVDGNVAEWCIADDGKGKILSGSAIMPTDPKFEYQAPRMEYVGFRVVIRE